MEQSSAETLKRSRQSISAKRVNHKPPWNQNPRTGTARREATPTHSNRVKQERTDGRVGSELFQIRSCDWGRDLPLVGGGTLPGSRAAGTHGNGTMSSPWCLGLQPGERKMSEFLARPDPSSPIQAEDKTGAQSRCDRLRHLGMAGCHGATRVVTYAVSDDWRGYPTSRRTWDEGRGPPRAWFELFAWPKRTKGGGVPRRDPLQEGWPHGGVRVGEA
jgi:hypothetical protein